jgi:GntR family transcriptional regulator
LAKTPSKPRYRQLADDLRGEILSGTMPTDAFPTESVLCARFGVSRFTVREALRQLQVDGLILRRRGSGTVVRASARDGALHQPLSNVGEILQYAADTQVTYAIGGVGLPAKLAAEIGLPTGKGWSHFRGVRTRDGAAAIAFVDAYIHPSLAAAVARVDLTGNATIFQQLERLADVRIARVTQDIQAIPASRDAAAALGVRLRAPALRILRCYLDANARVVEVSVSVHPGDRFAYAMHIEVEG